MSAAGKPLRPAQAAAQAAAQARAKLAETQAALDNGDYAQAIEGALALLTAEPQAAAVLLGRAACAVDDLTLVNRAYANLRQRPAALAPVTSDCKKQGIELGVSGQFVRTKTH